MAFRRKMIKSRPIPMGCSICKKKEASHTMHGNTRYGGATCCNNCWPAVKAEVDAENAREREYEPTEADYQTWMRL